MWRIRIHATYKTGIERICHTCVTIELKSMTNNLVWIIHTCEKYEVCILRCNKVSDAVYQYLVHILSPVTDNCSSWENGRRIFFHDRVSTKECAGRGDLNMIYCAQVFSLCYDIQYYNGSNRSIKEAWDQCFLVSHIVSRHTINNNEEWRMS